MFFFIRKKILIVIALFYMGVAYAAPAVRLMGQSDVYVPLTQITGALQREFNLDAYDEVRVRIINDAKNQPDHALIYLLPKNTHGPDIARINIDAKFNALSCIKNYQLTQQDKEVIEKSFPRDIECFDHEHTFVAFAPTNNAIKIQAANNLAAIATQDGFPGHSFYGDDADSVTFISYMLCPELKGIFFDGNGNSEAIIFVDREVTPELLKYYVKEGLKKQVVNLWAANYSFKDPLGSTMISALASQKYIGGTGELYTGPTEDAAVCMLKNAMGGEAMTSAFKECHMPEDHWGFDSKGSDYFGESR